MTTISNFISLLRAPLALLFLQQNIFLRLSSVVLAIITDGLDGYIARKSKTTSKVGVVLDPVMDKFFVYFVLTILALENQIQPWQIFTVISRDVALCIYGMYMLTSGKWHKINFHAIKWGKVTTSMQFLLIALLIFHVHIPSYTYILFVIVGTLALKELFSS